MPCESMISNPVLFYLFLTKTFCISAVCLTISPVLQFSINAIGKGFNLFIITTTMDNIVRQPEHPSLRIAKLGQQHYEEIRTDIVLLNSHIVKERKI